MVCRRESRYIELGIMPAGVYRRVFVCGNIVLKIPRLRHFLEGMCSNRWEREMWQIWRPFFGWRTLCPVISGDPAGFLLVMSRAHQPVTQMDIVSLQDAYPSITAESKPEDYGRLAARVVAVDYGLPDVQLARDQRAYYRSFMAGDKPHFNGEGQDA